jgi:hypothetical protein
MQFIAPKESFGGQKRSKRSRRGTARRRSPNDRLRIRIGAKEDGQEKGKEKGKENEKIESIQPLFYLPFFFEPERLMHTR